MKNYLITGAAGFIGSHVCSALLKKGHSVTGIDNYDPFYSRALKEQNIFAVSEHPRFRFIEEDITDAGRLRETVKDEVDGIVHLAAKAGVRPSIEEPLRYQCANVTGTQSVLELARSRGIKQFVFASSSSVYGINPRVPWREDDHVLQPISPYASTKVSGELLGHVYSHLYGIRFLALRFFTVYGPRQRPDLAIRRYAALMLSGKPIPVFGSGTSSRDYTYVEDVVAAICAALEYSATPFEIINIGNECPITLLDMIHGLEDVLGVTAQLAFLPTQPGDVPHTSAHIGRARSLLGYSPQTPFRLGLEKFARWLSSRDGLPREEQSRDLIGAVV